jgi:hypothetical protein
LSKNKESLNKKKREKREKKKKYKTLVCVYNFLSATSLRLKKIMPWLMPTICDLLLKPFEQKKLFFELFVLSLHDMPPKRKNNAKQASQSKRVAKSKNTFFIVALGLFC